MKKAFFGFKGKMPYFAPKKKKKEVLFAIYGLGK